MGLALRFIGLAPDVFLNSFRDLRLGILLRFMGLILLVMGRLEVRGCHLAQLHQVITVLLLRLQRSRRGRWGGLRPV